MLASLQQRVMALLSKQQSTDTDRAAGIRLATATLLAEIAAADGDISATEREALAQALQQHFDLDDDECAAVRSQGVDSAASAVSLQGFTRTLHENLSVEEKGDIIGLLWRVAAADGVSDKHEDARIAQIGELMYVPRQEVLRLRHEAGL